MFDNLKIKAMVRKVANESRLTYDDKILMYIDLFEHEPKKHHDLIKTYINEFSPAIWQEFNEYITIENATKIINDVSKNADCENSTLQEMMKKLK